MRSMEEKIETIKNWLGSGSINIFGLPFAGKDTQANKLADMVGGSVVSSGDVLRHDHGNKQIHDIMAAGGIIPSDLFGQVVVPYLEQDIFEGKPMILSEVGRMEGEQQVVMQATEESGHPTKAVILLKLDDSDVWNRFDASQKKHDRGERDDDNRAVLQNRLNKYHEKVTPVIEYYRDLGLLVEIDGTQSEDDVSKDIVNKLLEKSQR